MSPKSSASNVNSLKDLCLLLKILGDATRLKIVMILAAGERNVTSLCEELNLAQPVVSHHLGLLRMNGVVIDKRHGKNVVYTLASSGRASISKIKFNREPFNVTIERD